MGHVLDLLVGSVAAIRSVAHQVHFSSKRADQGESARVLPSHLALPAGGLS